MDRTIRWPLAILLITWAGSAFAQAPDATPSGPAQKFANEIPLYPGTGAGFREVGLDRADHRHGHWPADRDRRRAAHAAALSGREGQGRRRGHDRRAGGRVPGTDDELRGGGHRSAVKRDGRRRLRSEVSARPRGPRSRAARRSRP